MGLSRNSGTRCGSSQRGNSTIASSESLPRFVEHEKIIFHREDWRGQDVVSDTERKSLESKDIP